MIKPLSPLWADPELRDKTRWHSQRHAICAALDRNVDGLTANEVAMLIGSDAANTLSRLNVMAQKGWVRRGEERVACRFSDRPCYRWFLGDVELLPWALIKEEG